MTCPDIELHLDHGLFSCSSTIVWLCDTSILILSHLETGHEEDNDQTDGEENQSDINTGNVDNSQGSETNNQGGGTDTGSNQGGGSQQTGTWSVFLVCFTV